MRKKRFFGGAVAVVAILGTLVLGTAGPAHALGRSQRVAMVPNSDGQELNGGTLPNSIDGAVFQNPPFTTQPSMFNVSLAAIQSNPTDPLTTTGCGGNPCDTVVLVQVCDIATYLGNTTFNDRITNFAKNGGKLIIWDSECNATDYGKFVYPFATSNPGAAGATGTLTIPENNALGSAAAADSSFIDANAVATQTDAVGDANVFVSQDTNWCVSMVGKNTLGVNGGVLNYAKIGTGLIIYSGLDMDDLAGNQTVFDKTSTDGQVQLSRIWQNQLALTDTSTLTCSVKAAATLVLTPKTQTQVVGANATLTATATSNGLPLTDQDITLKVLSGPNTGKSVTAKTNAQGQATFIYTSTTAGTDQVEASLVISTVTLKDTAAVTWTAQQTTTTAAPIVTVTPRFTG